MDAKELAEILDGIEYPVRIQKSILDQAKDAGLVIVYGSSDDQIEFDGAFIDEAGCYGGGIVRFDKQGILPNFSDIEHEVGICREWMDRDKKRDIFKRFGVSNMDTHGHIRPTFHTIHSK